MGAKVVCYREAWWVRTHFAGTKKKEKKVGPTKADKRRAEKIAKKINGALALGTFKPDAETSKALPCDAELRRWHTTYSPTFSHSFERESHPRSSAIWCRTSARKISGEIGDEELLGFARAKLDAGQRRRMIGTTLSVLRRMLSLAHRKGSMARNPALRLSEIMRHVGRRAATEVRQAEAWTREEAAALLSLAREHEARLAPILHFLFATGARRGEALGLKWEDVDFSRGRIAIRRAPVAGEWTPPKSGKARSVAMPPALASEL